MSEQRFNIQQQYRQKFYQLPKVFFTNDKYIKLSNDAKIESSPDSCVKCYTMFLPFLLIKIDVFS